MVMFGRPSFPRNFPVQGGWLPIGFPTVPSALGPELLTNGHFETGDLTGWTQQGGPAGTVTDGVLETVASVASGYYQTRTLIAGELYRVTALIRRGTANGVRVRVNQTNAAGTIVQESPVVTETAEDTPISVYFNAPNVTNTAIYLRVDSAGTGYFSRVSLRRVL